MQHRTYVSLAYWARQREERHLQDEASNETLSITGLEEGRELEVVEGSGMALLDMPDAA